jgi:SAM-dependent methyltransferase
MFHKGIIDTYRKREPELLAELDAADKMGPGSVEYDPNFKHPAYYANVEFHIQPGSYHADPLAGHIYHYGTKVFFQGRNDNDDEQRKAVAEVPVPADGQVNRILDLACSIGQTSTAFKERFPNAEVWGIDAGAPMVRYAHKRAVEMGLDVHFAQRMAEHTGFPDNSFDIVYAFILFHELPLGVAEDVVREAHRVLRPGGVFGVLDFTTYNGKQAPALAIHNRKMDELFNAEPYSSDFILSDFAGMLRRHFAQVDDGTSNGARLPLRISIK